MGFFISGLFVAKLKSHWVLQSVLFQLYKFCSHIRKSINIILSGFVFHYTIYGLLQAKIHLCCLKCCYRHETCYLLQCFWKVLYEREKCYKRKNHFENCNTLEKMLQYTLLSLTFISLTHLSHLSQIPKTEKSTQNPKTDWSFS